MIKALRKYGLLATTLLLAAACSKDKAADKPAELVDIKNTAKVERVWSAGVGSGAPKLRLGLDIAVEGDAVYAASHGGEILALDLATGKRRWQKDTKLDLTGGPGVGSGLVVAGASHGDLIALDAATGEFKWRSRVNSEILAAPAVAGDVVLVRAVDGRVVALRTSDGSQLWSAEQQVPRLSLRGTTRPLIVGDLAVCGFDNGRVLALALADGATVWDTNVSPPAGRTELERLNDIDAAVTAVGTDLYAVTFQGKAARIDLTTGQVQWSRDLSSYSGLTVDDDGFYVSTADGTLVKVTRRTGIELWKQDVLGHRRLSAPAVLGEYVAVGDLDGYLHFFNRSTGEPAARVHALGARVAAPPIASGDLLVAADVEGRIVALRATAIAAAGDKAAKP